MKKILLLTALFFVGLNFLSAKSICINTKKLNEINVQNKGVEALKVLAGKDMVVFIETTDTILLAYIKKEVADWGYWKISDVKQEANFIMQVENKRIDTFNWQISAIFNTNEGDEIYKTPPTKKFGIGKLRARELSSSHLINNSVRPIFELD